MVVMSYFNIEKEMLLFMSLSRLHLVTYYDINVILISKLKYEILISKYLEESARQGSRLRVHLF